MLLHLEQSLIEHIKEIDAKHPYPKRKATVKTRTKEVACTNRRTIKRTKPSVPQSDHWNAIFPVHGFTSLTQHWRVVIHHIMEVQRCSQ